MKTIVLTFAALVLTGARLHAQAPADSIPACAEGGISRIAVTVPAGQTREQLAQTLQETRVFPEGTQIKILSPGERPEILNGRQFHGRLLMHLDRFLRAGLQVDGAVQALLEVNEDGVVTDVHPNTGHRDVDRGLRTLWRYARFEPVVVGGCRVPARLHMTLTFASDYGDWMRHQNTTYEHQ